MRDPQSDVSIEERWEDCERALERMSIVNERLFEALKFYADASIYDDWHDTGRTECQTAPKRVERFERGLDGRYEYAGPGEEEHEFDVPVWLTSAQEDSGERARKALWPLSRSGGTNADDDF